MVSLRLVEFWKLYDIRCPITGLVGFVAWILIKERPLCDSQQSITHLFLLYYVCAIVGECPWFLLEVIKWFANNAQVKCERGSRSSAITQLALFSRFKASFVYVISGQTGRYRMVNFLLRTLGVLTNLTSFHFPRLSLRTVDNITFYFSIII